MFISYWNDDVVAWCIEGLKMQNEERKIKLLQQRSSQLQVINLKWRNNLSLKIQGDDLLLFLFVIMKSKS